MALSMSRLHFAGATLSKRLALVSFAAATVLGVGCRSMPPSGVARLDEKVSRSLEQRYAWTNVSNPSARVVGGAVDDVGSDENPIVLPKPGEVMLASVNAPEIIQTHAIQEDQEFAAVVTADAETKPGKLRISPAETNKAMKPIADEANLAPPANSAEGPTVPVPTEPGIAADMIGPEAESFNIVGGGSMARLGIPYGVGPDEPGLLDNVSGRIGGAFYNLDEQSGGGFLGIVEGSYQPFQSHAWFLQGGVAGQGLAGSWPVSSMIGVSKLAVIEGGRVVKPLILSYGYDSYYDDEFRNLQDHAYLDQHRFLAGWAIHPMIDVGGWGAISGSKKTQIQNIGGNQLAFMQTSFADRAAGYVAVNVPKFNVFNITSAGWQDGGSNYFVESDTWIPLVRSINLWGGVGYSGNNLWDGAVGFEFVPSALGKRGRAMACCDPCDPCCDPCCVPTQYRGGWANGNGNYRGALRVLTPARARRSMMTTADPILPQAAPLAGGQDNPPDDDGCCKGRDEGRVINDGLLSKYLREQGHLPPLPTPGQP